MGSSSSETEFPVFPSNANPSFSITTNNKKKKPAAERRRDGSLAWPRKSKKRGGAVTLEGYVEAEGGGVGLGGGSGAGGGPVGRTKSLTGEDLEELKGCLDLGFGFSYEEIPELCNTLPALELCYSMSQRYLDEQQNRSPDAEAPAETPCSPAASTSPIANWRISSPGDDPDEVKARLKYWAQAVACTVRLCS